jgi:alpha-amylase
VENAANGFHGYWAQNIYAVNSNFGTEADLIALSAALHARGMYLMVDVVANHMGYIGCGNCVDYSVFTPFNQVCDPEDSQHLRTNLRAEIPIP